MNHKLGNLNQAVRLFKKVVALDSNYALESENKMLLLRIDVDNRQLRKIRNQNKTEHLNRYMETMTEAYPNKNWGFLYL